MKINSVIGVNTESKINSVKALRKADNNSKVKIDYNTLEQYYSQWYNVKFYPISQDEGVFRMD